MKVAPRASWPPVRRVSAEVAACRLNIMRELDLRSGAVGSAFAAYAERIEARRAAGMMYDPPEQDEQLMDLYRNWRSHVDELARFSAEEGRGLFEGEGDVVYVIEGEKK